MAIVLSDERASELVENNAKSLMDSVNSRGGFAEAHIALGQLLLLAELVDGDSDVGQRAKKAMLDGVVAIMKRSMKEEAKQEVREDIAAGRDLDGSFKEK